MMPPGLLIHGIRHPGKRPYLPAVSVAAELEVNPGILCILQMERLVVKEDSETV